jgi:hypothetical protein
VVKRPFWLMFELAGPTAHGSDNPNFRIFRKHASPWKPSPTQREGPRVLFDVFFEKPGPEDFYFLASVRHDVSFKGMGAGLIREIQRFWGYIRTVPPPGRARFAQQAPHRRCAGWRGLASNDPADRLDSTFESRPK